MNGSCFDLLRCVAAGACAPRACKFCNPLAATEWLAAVSDFAANASSATVTASRPTLLRKAPGATAASGQARPVPAGFRCERLYLQHYRGQWVCATDGQ